MILALDYGEKRIGVAITDESEQYAKTLEFIPNKSEVRKINAKDFPQNTSQAEITLVRKQAKIDAKVEFKKLCNKLLYLINCHYPSKIIVGLPTTVDQETGTVLRSAQAKKVEQFVKRFTSCLTQNKIVIDIEFIEESMTSQFASENLKAQGITTSGKIKEKIDSESAKIMLEDYLHAQQRNA